MLVKNKDKVNEHLLQNPQVDISDLPFSVCTGLPRVWGA